MSRVISTPQRTIFWHEHSTGRHRITRGLWLLLFTLSTPEASHKTFLHPKYGTSAPAAAAGAGQSSGPMDGRKSDLVSACAMGRRRESVAKKRWRTGRRAWWRWFPRKAGNAPQSKSPPPPALLSSPWLSTCEVATVLSIFLQA